MLLRDDSTQLGFSLFPKEKVPVLFVGKDYRNCNNIFADCNSDYINFNNNIC